MEQWTETITHTTPNFLCPHRGSWDGLNVTNGEKKRELEHRKEEGEMFNDKVFV